MQPENLREASDWLTRAERDLLAAEQVLQGRLILPEAAAFHSQQAAEKALQGFLAAHGLSIPRTHNVVLLARSCAELDERFTGFPDSAEILSPYAVRFRYPGGPLAPEPGQAEQALVLARQMVQAVQERLGPCRTR